MKRRTYWVLFIDLLSSWTETYKQKTFAFDTLKKVLEMTPHPPTHAKLRIDEVRGRTEIVTLEEWINQDGTWTKTTPKT